MASGKQPISTADGAGHGKGGVAGWLGLAFIVVLLDQLTKIAMMQMMSHGESRPITGFFNLVIAYNKGAAFSFLADQGGWQRWFFTGIAVIAVIFIVHLLRRNPGHRLYCTGLALILGGAIGNVIDRMMYGHVIDFLDFHVAGWHWPAFNIADAAIVVGAAIFIFDELRRPKR